MCVVCKYTITSRQDIMNFTVCEYNIIEEMLSYELRASEDPSIYLCFSWVVSILEI